MLSVLVLLLSCGGVEEAHPRVVGAGEEPMSQSDPAATTEEEWVRKLTAQQFEVLRRKGTERAFTGSFWNHWDSGSYVCAGCGAELFQSDTKFDAGCGWPSFSKAAADGRVREHADRSHGMVRTEVTCARCGGHLGHVFEDGPRPTGLRYCINSASLKFTPRAAPMGGK